MNIRRSKLAAAVMTAVFILSDISAFALPSKEWAQKDYRLMNIISKQGREIQKPTARFAAKRIAEGEVQDSVLSYADYDCTADFPTLTCYVGDTLAFEDMSYDNCGGKISEWDWQYYGTLGDSYKVYKNNIVESTSFEMTKPGDTMFYLCVKSDVKVKTGSCDPWSDNGNHQTVGRNKWFPKGAYWYFTAIRVAVKPARDAVVHVRYKNARNGSIIKTEDIPLGRLQDNETVDTSVNIPDLDGYSYSGWQVRLPDDEVQYGGSERTAEITLASWVPEKYLDIDYYPISNTEVEVRYWDTAACLVISAEKLAGGQVTQDGETQVTAKLTPPGGYLITGWNVQLPDGKIQYEGSENPTVVTLSGYIPKKYLNVECRKDQTDDGSSGGNPPGGNTEIVVKPSGVCDGVIEWTETDSHTVYYRSNGKRRSRTCTHTFKYRTVLGAEAEITPDTLKSGYGFEVNVRCTLNTTLVSNSGCGNWGANRTPTAAVKNPERATVYPTWTMTNRLGTQGAAIGMEKLSTLRFRLPQSPVSETGARRIYTPVELAGTKENPARHEFEIYVNGGGVGNIEFCKKLTVAITVNGDMYEDDFSSMN